MKLIKPGSGKWQSISNHVINTNSRLVAPPSTKLTGVDGYPKVTSYDMLGEQLHYSKPVKHGIYCSRQRDVINYCFKLVVESLRVERLMCYVAYGIEIIVYELTGKPPGRFSVYVVLDKSNKSISLSVATRSDVNSQYIQALQ